MYNTAVNIIYIYIYIYIYINTLLGRHLVQAKFFFSSYTDIKSAVTVEIFQFFFFFFFYSVLTFGPLHTFYHFHLSTNFNLFIHE